MTKTEMRVPFEITLPEDTPEYIAPAYFGCLRWALGKEEILNQFEKDTGKFILISRSGLDKLIDESTGFDLSAGFLLAFVPWFNKWIWGPMDGPGEK